MCERPVHVDVIFGLTRSPEATPTAIIIVDEGVDFGLGALDHLPKLPEGKRHMGTEGTADWFTDRDRRAERRWT